MPLSASGQDLPAETVAGIVQALADMQCQMDTADIDADDDGYDLDDVFCADGQYDMKWTRLSPCWKSARNDVTVRQARDSAIERQAAQCVGQEPRPSSYDHGGRSSARLTVKSRWEGDPQ